MTRSDIDNRLDKLYRFLDTIDLTGTLRPLTWPILTSMTLGIAGCDTCLWSTPEYGGPPMPPEVCDDGVDNNVDGLIDCRDPHCTGSPSCSNEDRANLRPAYGAPFPQKAPDPVDGSISGD